MDPAELAAVIAAAQAGEPAAFDRLIDAYAARLFGYLQRVTGSRTDAEDLLQDVFVRLVRAIGRYEHRDNFEAFLFRIAANLCHDHRRRRRRDQSTASLDAAGDEEEKASGSRILSGRPAPPEQDLEQAETARRLQVALAALPAAEREVVLLRHFTDLSFKEIAAALGTPLGTALARAHRGLIRLRDMVRDSRHD
jgi:RNA polymerase sigma-70 factor (ECF subfamily)